MVVFFSQGKMEYQCGHCGIIEEIMQRCSSCHVVYYCSRHCQKKDWKEKHRMVCNSLKFGYDPEEEVTSESSDSSINVVYSSESCANCGDQGILRKCAQCLSIQYCSKSCQRKHWPRHKGHCQQNPEVVEVIKTDGYKKQLREAKTERLQTRRLQQVLRYSYVPNGTEHPLDRRFGPSSRKTSHPFDLFENKSTSNTARKQAKLFVERKFPMQQIVDEVDGIPEPHGFFPSHGNSKVSFLGFITRYDSYRERHRVFVQVRLHLIL